MTEKQMPEKAVAASDTGEIAMVTDEMLARQPRGPAVSVREIADELRDASSIVVATHENPDGDAIGSARSMQLVLQRLGKDVVVYIPGAAVPKEYEFIRPEHLTGDIPEDAHQRLLLCLDCGNASRLASDELPERATRVINVDHHADNTHFGDLNHVRGDAACTTQLVRELAHELGVEIDADIGTAIYVGLVTDTGRFQYSNTTAEAFQLAAELVDKGVDTHLVFREVYERVEYPRLKLLSRGLRNARRFDDGRVIVTHLTRDDFRAAEADDDSSEGIVDFLRGVEGALVAVMVRDLGSDAPFERKGSLRTTRDDIDVSAIARSYDGGGHRQAAGFSTDDDIDAIVARVCEAVREQRAGTVGGAGAAAAD